MRQADHCPFCQSPDTKLIELDRHEWVVVCNGCSASGPIAMIPVKAAELWSRVVTSGSKLTQASD